MAPLPSPAVEQVSPSFAVALSASVRTCKAESLCEANQGLLCALAGCGSPLSSVGGAQGWREAVPESGLVGTLEQATWLARQGSQGLLSTLSKWAFVV